MAPGKPGATEIRLLVVVAGEEAAVGVEEEVPRLLEGAAVVGEEAVHH